jgi:hypothetical protein
MSQHTGQNNQPHGPQGNGRGGSGSGLARPAPAHRARSWARAQARAAPWAPCRRRRPPPARAAPARAAPGTPASCRCLRAGRRAASPPLTVNPNCPGCGGGRTRVALTEPSWRPGWASAAACLLARASLVQHTPWRQARALSMPQRPGAPDARHGLGLSLARQPTQQPQAMRPRRTRVVGQDDVPRDGPRQCAERRGLDVRRPRHAQARQRGHELARRARLGERLLRGAPRRWRPARAARARAWADGPQRGRSPLAARPGTASAPCKQP